VTPRAVLVTGAQGYLGRLVVEALADQPGALERIVALDVREAKESERLPGVTYIKGDVRASSLRDAMAAHRVDTVVHLASIVTAGRDEGARDFEYSVDVLGTRNVLEACVATGVKKLVVTSSGAAYGYHADNPAWLDEGDALRGNAAFAYAHHKKLVEELLAEYRARHPRLAQLVFRPGTILGAGARTPISAFLEKRVLLGVWGAPSRFVLVWDLDVVECIRRGVENGATGIYNLAGDGAVTLREIAAAQRKPYLPIPAPLLRGALRALRALGLTQYGPAQVDFLRHRPVLSNRRLKESFGFAPRKTREVLDIYLGGRADA
jgi:UDP-glucose 4-epimerase